jgi:hypothetical protein
MDQLYRGDIKAIVAAKARLGGKTIVAICRITRNSRFGCICSSNPSGQLAISLTPKLADANRARGSVLGRGNQVGPSASVTLCEAEANANEFGDVAAVPPRLPGRRLTL